MPELLASLLEQLNEQKMSPELSDKEALMEVKKAAKGIKVLCVLDDVVSVLAYMDKHSERPAHISLYHPTPHTVGCQVRAVAERDRR